MSRINSPRTVTNDYRIIYTAEREIRSSGKVGSIRLSPLWCVRATSNNPIPLLGSETHVYSATGVDSSNDRDSSKIARGAILIDKHEADSQCRANSPSKTQRQRRRRYSAMRADTQLIERSPRANRTAESIGEKATRFRDVLQRRAVCVCVCAPFDRQSNERTVLR